MAQILRPERALSDTAHAANRRWVSTGAVLATLLLISAVSTLGLGAYHEHNIRNSDLRSASHEAHNLARSLVQHTEDVVDLVNLALQGVAHWLETEGEDPQTPARVKSLLDLRKKNLPWLRGLFLYGPSGEWLATTEVVRLADLNNADRAYFQHHRANSSTEAFVGEPVRSKSSGALILTISRRVNRPDGTFAGVVLATVDVDHFAQNFARFDVGSAGSIALLGAGQRLLARFPSIDARLGEPVRAESLINGLATSPSGTVRFISSIDGVDRVAAFQRGDRYPLTVVVSRAVDEVLTEWRRDAAGRMAIVLALSLAALALGVVAIRQLAFRQQMIQSLAAREAEFRLLAESSSDMVTRVDPEGEMTYVSPAAKTVVGWDVADLLGGSIYHGIHEADVEAVRSTVDRILKGQQSECHLRYRNRHRESGMAWFETAVSASRNPATGDIDGLVGVTRNITQQKRFEEQLAQQAVTDGLTGLANRRFFDDRVRREFDLARDTGLPLGLLIIDVDHFKAFNDTYGHQAGDDCLRAVARAIQEQVTRAGDLAVRHGGEEFALILPETDLEGAKAVAARVHQALMKLQLPNRASKTSATVTVSLGGAVMDVFNPYRVPSDLIGAADVQLYAAKGAGRNQSSFTLPRGLRLIKKNVIAEG